MACGCGTYSITTTHPCNITAEVCFNYYIDITPYGTALSITDPPVNGEATILPNGNIRYTHDGENYDGDPFEYSFSGGSNGTGTCTVGIKVLEAIPPNTKVITLTASGECEVGNPTFEWELPECAELAPGYDIHDNPINVIVPIYDPENPDATCEIKVHVCCDYCNNCCKCENYIWTPPECSYPCGDDPVCLCDEPCEVYNPSTGSCEPCTQICCELGEGSYSCLECCSTDDCPGNQVCTSGNCGCPPGTIENEFGACCPTTLPACAICDNAGNIVSDVNIDCDEETEEIDYNTCTCVCKPGLCKDIITGECDECPPCVITPSRVVERTFGGSYRAYDPECPVCQRCVTCEECEGGYECIPITCVETANCNGTQVPVIVNPQPYLDYIDPCTGLLMPCSEDAPCCCIKNPPVEEAFGACCIDNECFFLTEAQCLEQGGIYEGDDVLCEEVTCDEAPPECDNSIDGAISCADGGCVATFTLAQAVTEAAYNVYRRNNTSASFTLLTSNPSFTGSVITVNTCTLMPSMPAGGQIKVVVSNLPDDCPNIEDTVTKPSCLVVPTCSIEASPNECPSTTISFTIYNATGSSAQLQQKASPWSPWNDINEPFVIPSSPYVANIGLGNLTPTGTMFRLYISEDCVSDVIMYNNCIQPPPPVNGCPWTISSTCGIIEDTPSVAVTVTVPGNKALVLPIEVIASPCAPNSTILQADDFDGDAATIIITCTGLPIQIMAIDRNGCGELLVVDECEDSAPAFCDSIGGGGSITNPEEPVEPTGKFYYVPNIDNGNTNEIG